MTPTTLLLVPTPLERGLVESQGPWPAGVRLELCGFGPLAAAARTAQLLAEARPSRVLLLGLAGSYDLDALPLASAFSPSQVVLDGVGAGQGRDLLGPAQMLPQWEPQDGSEPIIDRLDLAQPAPQASGAPGVPFPGGLLLTACAAAGDANQADERLERFPLALAEDMEAFGVALACRLAQVPCGVARGISNRVGDRDHRGWQFEEALAAARGCALDWLEAMG